VADYQQWDDYFWPDAPDVLRNKLNIRTPAVLSFVETQISYVRIYEHIQQGSSGAFDFAHFSDVHRHIFSDVYPWAGNPRVVPEVPMTKRGRDVVNHELDDPDAPTISYRYYPGPRVREGAETLFARLRDEDALAGLERDRFVSRLATYWGALDQVHPFREGNTRTQVAFFHSLCRAAGYDLGAQELRARRDEFVAARFHGQSVGNYRRLAALLSDTVQPRASLELTRRELDWASALYREAEHDEDLFRRVFGRAVGEPEAQQDGPSLGL
jgi:cell filamentation protein